MEVLLHYPDRAGWQSPCEPTDLTWLALHLDWLGLHACTRDEESAPLQRETGPSATRVRIIEMEVVPVHDEGHRDSKASGAELAWTGPLALEGGAESAPPCGICKRNCVASFNLTFHHFPS